MQIRHCDFEGFLALCCQCRVYGFGSGVIAEQFSILMRESGCQDRILGYVDNNQALWGHTKVVGEKDSPILSPDELRRLAGPDLLVVVACTDAKGVFEQLSGYPELEQVQLVFWQLMLSEELRTQPEPVIPRLYEEPRIPKTIHYCWFGGAPIPEHLQRFMGSWKEKCPDYEIVRWDESNYDVSKNLYMKQAYESKRWGFVSDVARLDVLYRYGGIYLDTDVELLQSLDPLLYQDGFCGFDIYRFINTGLGLGAVKGNPVIKALMEEYNGRFFYKPDGTPNLTTCILYQYQTFHRLGVSFNGKLTQLPHMTIYPAAVLGSYDPFSGVGAPACGAVSLHHYDSAWHTDTLRKAKQDRIAFFRTITV